MPGDLRQCMLAGTKTDLEPQFGLLRREGRPRICRLLGGKGQAWEGDLQQAILARAQPMTAAPPIQPVRRRFDDGARCRPANAARNQRPKAAFSPGTRSVFSHVKVPLSPSGSRPKWPYADVGT